MKVTPITLVAAVLLGAITVAVLSTVERPDVHAVAPRARASEALARSDEAVDLRLPAAEVEPPVREQPEQEQLREPAQEQHDRLRDTLRWLARSSPERFGELTLEQAQAMTALDLRGLDVTDADLVLLEALPNLESLGLRSTEITDAGLASLRRLGRLTSLDLRSTLVSGAGLSELPRQLEALHLTSTQVQGADLYRLPPMPDLQQLKLNFLELDDAALDVLAGYPGLRHVELDETAISDDGLRRLLSYNPEITRVEIRNTKQISAATVDELARLYPECEFVKDSPSPFVR